MAALLLIDIFLSVLKNQDLLGHEPATPKSTKTK
jgi:hypothetical protein